MGLHTPPHMPKILRTCYQWHIQSFLQRDLILKDAASSIEGITQSNINYLRKRKSEYSCDLLHSKMNENIFVDSFFFHLDLFVSWFFFSACIFVFSAISNFFFLIGIHSMQGWTATMRHGVTRKKAQKRLQDTENLFRKNLPLKDVC